MIEKLKTSIVVFIVLVMVTVIFAVQHSDLPQPPRNLRDFLWQTPNSVYQEFGYSEETFLYWNVVALKERYEKQEARIAALEGKVAELEIGREAIRLEPTPIDIDSNEVN
jgi:hypothetical protein